MHVHSLEFAAIGPFAGAHRIDFDGLGGASLFLIDGPTGAGKSTIIDALVFALFGDVAGRTSDKQRLRSAFARDEDETYAEVEFSTSFGRFRVRRTPEYGRAKRRGTGTTTVPSSVVLMRSVGEQTWESISTHKGEADAEIQRVIGLTRAQFLQTVVLPQGEFATFLSAESKDRLAVLQRIFATDVYARIEDALEAKRLEAQRTREAADREVRTALKHVMSRLSDVELGDRSLDVADDADPDAVLALVAELELEATDRLVSTRVAFDAVATERDRVKARWQAAADRAAAQVAVDKAQAEVVVAEEAFREAQRHQAEFSSVMETVPSEDDDLVGAVDRLVGALAQAAVLEESLPVERRAIDDAEHVLETLGLRLESVVRERDHDLPARLLALSAALRTAVGDAQERLRDAALREAGVVQARLDGMAGELAGELADEQPCPVCGSLDHPAPAGSADHPTTATEVDAARRARVEAENHLRDWQVEQARLATLAGERDLSATDVGAADVRDIVEGISLFQKDVHRLEAEAARLRDQQTQQAADLKAQVESLRDRERQVAIARADGASVAERLAQRRPARAGRVATDEAAARVTVAVGAAALAADALARFESDDGGRDVDGLAAAFRALEDQVQVTVSARDAAESLVGDLHKRAGLARAAVERVHDTYSATTDVIALANIMRGGDGNTLAQPLSAYVVQTMFDEILQAANRRLQEMLDGRFSLQATERRTGNARLGQGLGLEVVDQRTDTVRKTATLSGGESFCASLALALGLADTVRSHAGGVELGMLFIDEGFGSLDGHRLDEVMAELLRLRSDGRTVGVISHVSEMKKGINERIDVTALDGRRGSTLSVSWTD